MNLSFLCLIGLRDKLRKSVKSLVHHATSKNNMQLRLVSGDHIETARKIAFYAEILSLRDQFNPRCVMEANEFRSLVGEVVQRRNELTDEVKLELERMDEFKQIIPDLRVIARATPLDKHLLIVGLQAIGKSVAMTGESSNDEEALKRADVGIALKSGCSLAKENAEVVLTNDDLNSVVKAVMWGRNLKSNIGRFLQFQLTVNLSVILVVVAGHLFFLETPISTV